MRNSRSYKKSQTDYYRGIQDCFAALEVTENQEMIRVIERQLAITQAQVDRLAEDKRENQPQKMSS